jgi:hypothetical protein
MKTQSTGLRGAWLATACAIMIAACTDGKEDKAADAEDMAPGQDMAQVSDMPAPPADMPITQPDMADQPDMPPADMPTGPCRDVPTFVDADGDGFGVADQPGPMACLRDGEAAPAGFAVLAGDCDDADAIQHDGAEGICGDNVDDSCDGKDEVCPTTMPAGTQVPAWDCVTGAPPDNVVAFARFEDGKTFFKPNGCFIFFEGAKNSFFVAKNGVTPAKDNCTASDGCVCPSLNGWPSYDRRLYALTLAGDAAECEQLQIIDHAGEDQPVSNTCRKYLYQLHKYNIPYSYIAGSLEGLNQRINTWSTVEIACLRDAPHANLPFATLLTAPIQRNPGFVKK